MALVWKPENFPLSVRTSKPTGIFRINIWLHFLLLLIIIISSSVVFILGDHGLLQAIYGHPPGAEGGDELLETGVQLEDFVCRFGCATRWWVVTNGDKNYQSKSWYIIWNIFTLWMHDICSVDISIEKRYRGRSKICMGGGGPKIMCAHTHHKSEAQSPLHSWGPGRS